MKQVQIGQLYTPNSIDGTMPWLTMSHRPDPRYPDRVVWVMCKPTNNQEITVPESDILNYYTLEDTKQ